LDALEFAAKGQGVESCLEKDAFLDAATTN